MSATTPQPLARLRRLVRQSQEAARASLEGCDLCSAEVASEHRHVLDVPAHQVRCVCYPCSILFNKEAASNGRLKLIPQRKLYLSDFVLADAEWDRLRVPVGIAFMFESTPEAQPVAMYPSPMGATRALLEPDVWRQVRDRNPVLETLQPDVEALLVDRTRSHRDHYLVPIDECYRLTGIIRGTWRGLTGGKDVWQAVDGLLAALHSTGLYTARGIQHTPRTHPVYRTEHTVYSAQHTVERQEEGS